jgi:hypothetical protein
LLATQQQALGCFQAITAWLERLVQRQVWQQRQQQVLRRELQLALRQQQVLRLEQQQQQVLELQELRLLLFCRKRTKQLQR